MPCVIEVRPQNFSSGRTSWCLACTVRGHLIPLETVPASALTQRNGDRSRLWDTDLQVRSRRVGAVALARKSVAGADNWTGLVAVPQLVPLWWGWSTSQAEGRGFETRLPLHSAPLPSPGARLGLRKQFQNRTKLSSPSRWGPRRSGRHGAMPGVGGPRWCSGSLRCEPVSAAFPDGSDPCPR